MLSYLIKHPTLPNLIMILALIVGGVSLFGIKRETFPTVNPYAMNVTVVYAGANAQEIESSICDPLEEATSSLSDLKEKTCTSQENSATLSLRMRDGGDYSKFKDDIKSIVDSISSLPSEAEDPVVTEAGLSTAVVSLAVYGPIPSLQLHDLTELIKDDLMNISGVSDVDLAGFDTRQIKIEVDPNQLQSLGLSITQLASTISNQSKDMPLGTLETSDRQISLRVSDQRRTVESFENMVIRASEKGGELTLGDVADIYEDFKGDSNRIEFNGENAGVLTIYKNTEDDGQRIFNKIVEYVDETQMALPQGIELELTNDMTTIAQDRLKLITNNGIVGLVLVFLVVWMFFSWKYSFWVAMGLPVSFFASFAVMAYFQISLNMISMVALLISLGILMDDAIVISESIAERIRNARDKLGHKLTNDEFYDAVREGVVRVRRGVLSSFATTVMIFSGTLMIKGDMGQVLIALPIVLLLVVSISLFEAFFILPNHLAHASLKDVENDNFEDEKTGFKAWLEGAFEKLSNTVHRGSTWAVKYPYIVLGTVLILFFGSISLIAGGVIKFSPFPATEGNAATVYVHMPAGTTQDRTEAVVAEVVAALHVTNDSLSLNETETLVKNIQVKFGSNVDVGESGDHVATLSVDLFDAEFRNTKMSLFIADWRENIGVIPDAKTISIKEPTMGPAGQAIEIRMSGADLDELDQASEDIKAALYQIESVVNLSDDLNAGKRELQFSLKPGAYSLGMTSNSIASQLRSAFVGQKLDEIQQDGRSTEVVLGYSESAKNSLEDLDTLVLFSDKTGQAIPIDQVADVSWNESWSKITHINNLRTVTVKGDVDPELGNTSEVNAKFLADFFPDIKNQYPDIAFSFDGEQANTKESVSSLGTGFLFALFGVYILLSAQFRNYSEPLMVMSVIPLALIGSIGGHWVMGVDFTMPSMMGFISLGGIVVNNSILLSEFIRIRMNENGLSLKDAAARAAKDRFRSIFMTSMTTVVGMTPMLFETSLQAQILIPLITSMLFGLISSGLLVLFVVPALYSILSDLKGHPETLEHGH